MLPVAPLPLRHHSREKDFPPPSNSLVVLFDSVISAATPKLLTLMVGKIQLIDDHRCSRLRHLLARCRETITPCRLASVGWTLAFLCDEVVKQALDACMHILPRVVFGTNQTEAAYHQVLRGNRKNRAPSLLRQRASRRATMRVH